MQNMFVGLDIGSGSIRAIVAELKKDGRLSISHALKFSSEGVRKGNVDDLPSAARSISVALGELKQISKDVVKNMYVGIGSPYVKMQFSKGIIAVSRADLQICEDDIARVREAAESVKLPPNRMVVHAITDEFVVDDIADIKDPLGMVGNRLEAKSVVIDGFAPSIRNLARAVEIAGGSVAGFYFNPIASSRAVLTRNQKDLGVLLIDLGLGTTSFAVYQDNKLLHAGSLHFGAGHITQDVALGLKMDFVAAEGVKTSFGSALAKEVPPRETIDLVRFDSNSRGNPLRRFVAEIIESRLSEIFEFINADLRHAGRAGQLPGGAVLVGGGAKTPALVDLVIQELRLPARVGVPDLAGIDVATPEVVSALEDPEFACGVGLIKWGAEKMMGDRPRGANLLEWARNIGKYFMP
jgi:cell division protein FtsA